MRSMFTLFILMWLGIFVSTQCLSYECIEMVKTLDYEEQRLVMIQEFGGAGQFFYNDMEDIFVEYNGHIYKPVLLEHQANCPCECLQSDTRKQFDYIEVEL